MKLSALITASGLIAGLNAFTLTFYSGASCRSANLGSYESNFFVCGIPPANSRSVIISNSVPEDSARRESPPPQSIHSITCITELTGRPASEMHFYNDLEVGGCSESSVIARSGCVTLDDSITGWQSQVLGTPGNLG